MLEENSMLLIYTDNSNALEKMNEAAAELGVKSILLKTDPFFGNHSPAPKGVIEIKTYNDEYAAVLGQVRCIPGLGDYSRSKFIEELIDYSSSYKDIVLTVGCFREVNDIFEKNVELIDLWESQGKRLHLLVACLEDEASNLSQAYLRTLKNVTRYYSVGFFDTSPIEDDYGFSELFDAFLEENNAVLADMLLNILVLDKEKIEGSIFVYNRGSMGYDRYYLRDIDIAENYSEEDFQRMVYSHSHIFEETIAPNKGKETCKELKKLRSKFAVKYGKKLKEDKCRHTGPCQGTCAECDRCTMELSSDVFGPLVHIEDTSDIKGDIRGTSRLRMDSDGKGIRTLVVMNGCELGCKYCINKGMMNILPVQYHITPKKLAEMVNKDSLYYDITDGGITFGGGEPLLQSDFILRFHELYPQFDIAVETSLNVTIYNVIKLLKVVSEWIVDIKDINPDVYTSYTGYNNDFVIRNLKYLADKNQADKVRIRVPLIEGFNTEEQRVESINYLRMLGYTRFDEFTYQVL